MRELYLLFYSTLNNIKIKKKMKKSLSTLAFLLLFAMVGMAQNKRILTSPVGGVSLLCKCSDLVIYPYFYYQDPQNAPNSSLYLRFDFQHKGKIKCKPEFAGSITIYRSDDITVTIPLSNLTSFVDTDGQRIFVVTQLNLPNSFRPMTLGGNYKITYSLKYGTGICPATSTKIVRFAKSEPIL
jgi:hypothetical protein